MRCLPCGTEMRSVEVVTYQAIVKARELHTFKCPNCGRTERRLLFAHSIGSFLTERMQLASTTLPLVTPLMHKTVVVSRNGWTCMVRTLRYGTFSASVLVKRVLVAARHAWAQTTVTLRSSACAGAPKSADSPVEKSTKYNMVNTRKIAEALRSILSPKLLVLAEEVISGPRRNYILSGAACALILAILLQAFAPGRNIAAVPTGVSHAGQASTETSSTPTAVTSEASSATALTTTGPASATEQSAVPGPLALADPADRVIAEKIRDLLAEKSRRIYASTKDREAIEAFYQKRNLAAFWLDKGVENARAKSIIARITNADTDGLELRDYNLPNFAGLGPQALAEADVKLTQTVLTFARHLQAGRFPYHFVSRNIQLPQAPPEPSDVLSRISAAADPGKALDEFSPQQEPYRKLRTALAELRGKTGGAGSEIAEGPVLSYSRSRQIETIIANMERWRWLPRDLGNAHVLVNEPDFTLKVMHNGAQVWATRIVIGKPSMPTPLLSETMKSITINPTWNVPPSIVHNEYLPALAQDPTVLARMGLRVSYSGGEVQITQPPGPGNALGRIRFNFPNRFLVYQHDTPDKYMFGQDLRTESHGCMRVQDPAKYAEVLFNIARPDDHWTAEKVTSMFGRVEQDIQLQPAQIWVHLTYQTAFVDDDGKLQMRRDVYNLDSRTIAAIRSERAIIEPISEGRSEQVVAAGSGVRRVATPRPGSFFPPLFFHGRPLRPPRGIGD